MKKTSSKQSIYRQPNHISTNQPLKPLRKVARKFRSRSANPPSITGPSRVLLPPMAVHHSADGRPVSLMRGSILRSENNPPLSENPSPPNIPELQLRLIQSAPTVTRSVNLPPILGSKTPSKPCQSERKGVKNSPLASLKKKTSFEEYEENGGILAPRR